MKRWLHKLASSPQGIKLMFRLWPPLWFTGIRFAEVSDDLRSLTTTMSMRAYNKNIMGVHFGGSLFAMTDPCYMMLLMTILGKEYVVWDKAASIEFVKPGIGKVTARFELSQSDIDDILHKTSDGSKYFKTLPVVIKDESGEAVAKLERTLYIRKKRPA